jgi:predicted nucleic-acid-binding protein
VVIALDTNVLVRYLAQDERRQSAIATRLIEKTLTRAEPGFVSLVALLETVWVMESVYAADAATIAGIIRDLLDSAALQVQDSAAVADAVSRYGEGGHDLHDCLIVSLAARRGAKVVTFDAKASRRLGMELLR